MTDQQVTLPLDVVRAVFDIATAHDGCQSQSLDTEEVGALLAMARAILPADDETVLDLAAQQREMAVARAEPHEFKPDRPGEAGRCLECGRYWWTAWHHPETDAERQLRIAREQVEAARQALGEELAEQARVERRRLWSAEHPADVLPDGGF